MPVTLSDARRLTQDKLAQVVIDEFRQDDLMNRMLFDDNAAYNGGSTLNYVYNRVDHMRSAGFREINTEYVAEEATTKLVTVTLKPFGGTYGIDRVIADHVHGVTNQIVFQQQQLVQATIATFSDTFVNGDIAVDAKAFDGLDKAITGSTTDLALPAIDLSTSAAIDTNWKAFMDGLRRLAARLDGSTTFILVNREMYSVFQSIADRATSFTMVKSEFGMETLAWNSIPIVRL
ncbi:MAG: phage capsid protein, partial [Symbiobacteriaceae bacterium]|nr:phage capsid protein [Symbiobacteriaceae bacterium]